MSFKRRISAALVIPVTLACVGCQTFSSSPLARGVATENSGADSLPYQETMVFSNAPHRVQLLDVGSVALRQMLYVIESAKEYVEITNYLINFYDNSAQIVLDALRRKRLENPNFVARFILEDSTSAAGGFKKDNFWQWRELFKKAKSLGIEFRIFNPRDFNFINANVRMHQKIVLADGQRLVAGGRNFSDDYFGIIATYNRLDKEIYIEGPIAQAAHQKFQQLWNSPFCWDALKNSDQAEHDWDYKESIKEGNTLYNMRASQSSGLKDMGERILGGLEGLALKKLIWIKKGGDNITVIYPDRVLGLLQTTGYSSENATVNYQDFLDFQKIHKEKKLSLMSYSDFRKTLEARYQEYSAQDHYPLVTVNKVGLGFDFAGQIRKKETFVHYFYETMRTAQKELLMENQYFIPSKKAANIVKEIQEKNVAISFLTNSAVSQDETNPGTLTHKNMRQFLVQFPQNFHGYAFRGQNLQGIKGAQWWSSVIANPKVVWQIHAKAMVIDQKSSWVGSNNFDNRSEEFNPEMAFYIPDNEEFASHVYRSIQSNIANSDNMAIKGTYWQSYNEKLKNRSTMEKLIDLPVGAFRDAFQDYW